MTLNNPTLSTSGMFINEIRVIYCLKVLRASTLQLSLAISQDQVAPTGNLRVFG